MPKRYPSRKTNRIFKASPKRQAARNGLEAPIRARIVVDAWARCNSGPGG